MKYQREQYEQWIQSYLQPRYAELVTDLRACLNGYERIKATNRVDKNSLKSIVHAACSSRVALFDTATRFLSDLSADYPEAREAILDMSNDPRWYVRSNALLSLDQRTPSSLVLVLLKKALQDRSSRVRGLAAWRAQLLHVLKVIPDLENQLTIEPHPGTKFSIDFHLRLLRDGYALEHQDKEMLFIWISTKDGMLGRSVSQEDIDAKGIQVTISEILSNLYD